MPDTESDCQSSRSGPETALNVAAVAADPVLEDTSGKPSSKELLLQLEGRDPAEQGDLYIPSYFRRSPMPAHDAECSTITLAKVQNLLRDLNTNGGHSGPNFPEVVTPKLEELRNLSQTLREDHLTYQVRFAPGQIADALDVLIEAKRKQTAIVEQTPLLETTVTSMVDPERQSRVAFGR